MAVRSTLTHLVAAVHSLGREGDCYLAPAELSLPPSYLPAVAEQRPPGSGRLVNDMTARLLEQLVHLCEAGTNTTSRSFPFFLLDQQTLFHMCSAFSL